MAGPYAGDDILSAIFAWWQDNGTVQAYASDRRLWHQVAPQAAVLPYVTFFIVHEIREVWTTAYAWIRATVQVNAYAVLDADAREAATTIGREMQGAPLVVLGSAVTHVLRDASGLYIGHKMGPDGNDIWVGFVTFDICWTEDM